MQPKTKTKTETKTMPNATRRDRIDWSAYNATGNAFCQALTQGEEGRLAPDEIKRANELLAQMNRAALELDTLFRIARRRFVLDTRPR